MGKTLHNMETSQYNAAENAHIATVGYLELEPILPRPHLLFLLLSFLFFPLFPFRLFLSFLSLPFVSVLSSLPVLAPLHFAS